MITQRQKAFRQEYRSRIMGWYDGYLHVAIIYAMGAAAFYIYIRHIHDVTPLEWLTVPLTFLFTRQRITPSDPDPNEWMATLVSRASPEATEPTGPTGPMAPMAMQG